MPCDHRGVKIFQTDSLPLQNQSNSPAAARLTEPGSIRENTPDFPAPLSQSFQSCPNHKGQIT